MLLFKIDIGTIAKRLTRPFLMERIARIDHFAAYMYLCHGAVARHRHMTQDELFYVHSGRLKLDTDLGQLALGERELAVIPQGLAHLSSAMERTIVLLFQAQSDPERKNGHGRLALEGMQTLPKISLNEQAGRLSRPFVPRSLAQVDEMSLRMLWCEGTTLWHVHETHDELLWVLEGRLDLGTELGPLSLSTDELIVIPRKRIHRLTSSQRTLALSLIHDEVSPAEHMGQQGEP